MLFQKWFWPFGEIDEIVFKYFVILPNMDYRLHLTSNWYTKYAKVMVIKYFTYHPYISGNKSSMKIILLNININSNYVW